MFDFITGRDLERREELRQVKAALSGELERTRGLVRDIDRYNDPIRTTDAQIMDYLRRTAQVTDRGKRDR
jgi:hypothetical protein